MLLQLLMLLGQTDVINEAEKVAHLSDRGILSLVVIVGGGVIGYLFRSDQKNVQELFAKLDKRTEAMDDERRKRIEMLLTIIEKDTEAKAATAQALVANTETIQKLQTFIGIIYSKLMKEQPPAL